MSIIDELKGAILFAIKHDKMEELWAKSTPTQRVIIEQTVELLLEEMEDAK